MKFGMNLLLRTGELSDELVPVLESLKKMGYDGVELPLFNYDLDYAAWGRRLDELGLERTAVTVRTEEDNPISPEADVRAKAADANRQALDCCAAVGATALRNRLPAGTCPARATGQRPKLSAVSSPNSAAGARKVSPGGRRRPHRDRLRLRKDR